MDGDKYKLAHARGRPNRATAKDGEREQTLRLDTPLEKHGGVYSKDVQEEQLGKKK